MNLAPLPPPILIDTPAAFPDLVDALSAQARLGVDTESNSLHAYRERVCLLQFSTATQDYILDPLAIEDLGPLAGIFSSPDIEKVFHASEYDVICLRRDFGYSFNNIFDTMQAGRILGRKQAGLDRLLEDKFGIKTSKHLQKANWGVRPLPQASLMYAAMDTHYLLPLRDLLEAELRARDLWQLALEDFRMACNASAQKPATDASSWSRFNARRDLSPRELTVLKELISCRDEIASRLNRPAFKVLGDDRLLELAKAQPGTWQDLEALGLGGRELDLVGRDVLHAVSKGLESPLVERRRPLRPATAYLKRLEKLKEWRKKAAAEMDVESDVVLPRGVLLALAENGGHNIESIMEAFPWRLRRFGGQITGVLAAIESS